MLYWPISNFSLKNRNQKNLPQNVICDEGAQWLSGRVLDSRPRGHRFEPHPRHCVMSLHRTSSTQEDLSLHN